MLILQAQPVIAPPSPVAVANGPAGQYEALVNQRSVLRDQLSEMVEQRSELVTELRTTSESGVGRISRTGLEDRIAALDKRIVATDQEIALVDAQVAKAASIPGAVIPSVKGGSGGGPPSDTVIALGVVFMLVVFLPLSIAFARRIWNRGAATVSAIPTDLMARLQRIEQAVEASGLEIERIGEGQRFVTKLFSEKVPALPAARDEPRAL